MARLLILPNAVSLPVVVLFGLVLSLSTASPANALSVDRNRRAEAPRPAGQAYQPKQATRAELTAPRRKVRRSLISSGPAPDTITFDDIYVFTKFYSGSGYTETDDNPCE
jgi:hypothetical protein